MDHLLNLSKAAKLAGVSRHAIQEKIRNGALQTFEGEIRMSALVEVYPDVESKPNVLLEKLARIQENASHKINSDGISNERLLVNQMHHLQRHITEMENELDSYKLLVNDLIRHLETMKLDCDHDHGQMVVAMIGWILQRKKEHS